MESLFGRAWSKVSILIHSSSASANELAFSEFFVNEMLTDESSSLVA